VPFSPADCKESLSIGRGFDSAPSLRVVIYLFTVSSEGMRFAVMPHLPDKTTTNLRCSPSRGGTFYAPLNSPTSRQYHAARTALTGGVDAAWRGTSSRSVSMAYLMNMIPPLGAGLQYRVKQLCETKWCHGLARLWRACPWARRVDLPVHGNTCLLRMVTYESTGLWLRW
jgi:hypothetical protein